MLGKLFCCLVDGTVDYFKKVSQDIRNEKTWKEQKENHLEWQKKESALSIIKRKNRMTKLNGLDLRYTHESSALLCDENYDLYNREILIDCTDLNNPKEYFTGLSLKSSDGIFLVKQYRDSDDIYYYSKWDTINSVSKKLKDEFPADFANYKSSGLGEINSLEELTKIFGKYSNKQNLDLYINDFYNWRANVKNNYILNHNVNNISTDTGVKILKLGAKNNSNTNKR